MAIVAIIMLIGMVVFAIAGSLAILIWEEVSYDRTMRRLIGTSKGIMYYGRHTRKDKP